MIKLEPLSEQFIILKISFKEGNTFLEVLEHKCDLRGGLLFSMALKEYADRAIKRSLKIPELCDWVKEEAEKNNSGKEE
jgi:hypothetical protein